MSDIIKRLEKEDKRLEKQASVRKMLAELSQWDDITDIAVVVRRGDAHGTFSRRWLGEPMWLMSACRIMAAEIEQWFLSEESVDEAK